MSDEFLWIVLEFEVGRGWCEVGRLTNGYGYAAPDPSEIGEVAGAGEFLLVCEQTEHVARRSIKAETAYEIDHERERSR